MPELDHVGYRFILIAFIVSVNAFFAAAEVSLLSVRKSRLRALADEGNAGATAALNLLANPERLLSVMQVGLTLASLILGWAGEETINNVIIHLFKPVLTPATAGILHGVSFGLAFLLMTYVHVVIGEVVPKNLAIEKADRLAIIVAPAVLIFYRIAEPFVFVLERSATIVSKWLGLRGAAHGGGHSVEEVKFIISSSRKEGHLEQFEEEAIHRLLELDEFAAREIMVPRNRIVSVSVNATLDHVLKVMNEHQYSRLAVYERTPENIVGIVHFKDLVRVWLDRRAARDARRPVTPFRLTEHMRKPLVVPESKAVNELIDEFRGGHAHMAIVVDEFGTISGMLTLEDVLEQVFGPIEDEHDLRPAYLAPEAPLVEVDGTINIRDLDTQYGIDLPGDAGFQTLAGFLLLKLGRIPEAGASLEYGNRKFTILQMDRNRIALVRIETPPKTEESA